jgi:DegV family protein with EDD domain
MGVKILTDSTSYIDKHVTTDLDIKTVSLNVIFGNESFRETDLDNNDFYKMMDMKGIPTSSQPSIDELYTEMEAVVKQGDSLLCIFLSSAMSGTYSTAHIARDMILEHYKSANIELLDSRSNSMQLGFAVIVAARAAKEGKTLDQVKEVAKGNIKRSRFLFIPNNLVYLKKGGRIGTASALIGNLLKIIPILTVENGVTTILTKVRTKKKAVITMVDTMLKDIEDYGLSEIVVHHINCYEEAKELANAIGQKLNININVCALGPVIGLHVGPGTVAIAYYTEKDMR